MKKVKEEDLAHGQFGKWLESINMTADLAQRFMKITREIPNADTYRGLGYQALYLIATMPEEERNQPQQLDSGETKKPEDMTVRELREVKRKLKMAQEENRDKDLQIERLNNQPKLEPKVIEKEVEVEKVPDDYQQLKQQVQTIGSLRDRNNELQGQIDDLNSKLSEMNAKGQEYEELQEKIDKLEKQRSNVRQSIDAGSNIMLLNDQLKELFDTKLSALRYKNFFADDPMTSTVKETEDLLDTLQGFIDDMRHILPQQDRKIIEGKFSE